MKKIMIALLLAAGLLSAQLEAGNLVSAGRDLGKGTRIKDSGNGLDASQTFDRGIHYSTSTAATISGFATNSSLSLTLTGSSTNYIGPWYVWYDNTCTTCSDVLASPRTSVTAATSMVAMTKIAAGTSGVIGPISRSATHMHFLGLSATTNIKAGVGYLE